MLSEKVKNAIREYLKNAFTDEIISIVQEIHSCNGELEEFYWYSMDEFDEQCGYMTPMQIANSIYYGDFRPNDSYFQYDGYGNFVSADYIELDESDINDFIEVIEYMPYIGVPSAIKEIIEENEVEEEEN